MKKYLLMSLVSLLLLSCNNDEKLIDNTIDNWKLLVSINNEIPRIELISIPDGAVLNSDIFFNSNEEHLKGIVKKIVEFRDNLYLFIPDLSLIEVVNKDSFKRVATLDFSTQNLAISDICFPNATDAYLTHPNDSVVSLIDITNFQVARTIKVGKGPTGIVCAGNQIFVANTYDNSISIIDSRTHQQEELLKVAPYPMFIDVTMNGKYAIAISLGQGKIDSLATKSAAVATFINIATRKVDYTKELGNATVRAIDAFPKGIVIPSNLWAFLPVKDYLMQLETKTGSSILTLKNLGLIYLFYNYKRNEVVALKYVNNTYKVAILNPSNGQSLKEYKINDNTIAIHPI